MKKSLANQDSNKVDYVLPKKINIAIVDVQDNENKENWLQSKLSGIVIVEMINVSIHCKTRGIYRYWVHDTTCTAKFKFHMLQHTIAIPQ